MPIQKTIRPSARIPEYWNVGKFFSRTGHMCQVVMMMMTMLMMRMMVLGGDMMYEAPFITSYAEIPHLPNILLCAFHFITLGVFDNEDGEYEEEEYV